jgi:hypothetical protein
MSYDILGHGSLRIESEDGLNDFIRKGIKNNRECLASWNSSDLNIARRM